MNPIIKALLAAYNFFSGDALLLSAGILAFVVAWLLVSVAHAPNTLAAVIFVALLAAGLATTLAREAASHKR